MGRYGVLDIFAGGGGLSLGFEQVRDGSGNSVFEIQKAVEIEEFECQTLKKHFENVYPSREVVIQGDITKWEVQRELIEECRGRVNVIVGGIPCQSFSNIGTRSGHGHITGKSKNDKRDFLYRPFLSVVRRLKPDFIVLENVRGIISKKNRDKERHINIIVSRLKSYGYRFESENPDVKTPYLILNAADYGVPQKRIRVFLIGNRLRKKNPYPESTHYDPLAKDADAKKKMGLLPWVTVQDAIGDLLPLKAKITFTDIPLNEREHIMRRNKRRFNGADEVVYSNERFQEHYNSLETSGRKFLDFVRPDGILNLAHHVARPQKLHDIILFEKLKEGETSKDVFEGNSKRMEKLEKLIKYKFLRDRFSDAYRKQKWDRPSTTIFAHLEKDGNRFIHPDGRQARTFTVREAARLQSFPDDYEFEGSYNKKFRQIGNAVPPLLSSVIAKSIAEKLNVQSG